MSKKFKNNFSSFIPETDYFGLGMIAKPDYNKIYMYNKTDKKDTLDKTTMGLVKPFDNIHGENLQNGYEDGIKLFYSDPQSNIIDCKKGGDYVQCCKNNDDIIVWEHLKSGNTFSCIDKGSLSPSTPWPGHYICTSQTEESSPKHDDKRYRQLTLADVTSIPSDQIVLNPEICNLTNKTINIQATELINEDGRLSPTIQNFPLCSLIRNHMSERYYSNKVTPGCADVDNRLSTYTANSAWSKARDDCVYKDNDDPLEGKCISCGLNRVDLDNNLIEGVNTSAFTGGGGSWGGEKDWMCSAHPVKFNNTYNIPYNCNWNWDISKSKPCGDAKYDYGCALRFQLNNKKNPHACDNYNKSEQYNNLCKNVNCSWTVAYNCPNQPKGLKGPAAAHGNFDINYHCCCDLDGWKNL